LIKNGFFIGIDSGGSKCEIVFTNKALKFLFRHKFSIKQFNIAGGGEVAEKVISEIINILKNKNLSLTNCLGIGACFAGVRSNKDKLYLKKELSAGLMYKNIVVETDTLAALYGAFGGKDGIILICGTGSVIFGKNKNKLFRIGGWGRILGDEGSGYNIGLRALKEVVKDYDSGLSKSILCKAIENEFKLNRDNLIQKIYRENFPIQDIAPVVINSVAQDCKKSLNILISCCRDLMELMHNYLQRVKSTEKINFVFSGGLLETDNFYSSLVSFSFRKFFSDRLNFIEKIFDASTGAVLIAKEKIINQE